MSSEQSLLPLDIVVEILTRVPAKSLMRFRCVCKPWRSLISDPSFISLHRLRNSHSFLLLRHYEKPSNPNSIPFLSPFLRLHRHQFLTLSDTSFPLPLPPTFNRHSYVSGACHGLLCITTYVRKDNDGVDFSYIICNPSIRRYLSLPKPLPFPHIKWNYTATFAFGFDSRNNDYKIVRIVRSFIDSYTRVEVFSLASSSWKILPESVASSFNFPCSKSTSHGFINGRVHWGVWRKLEDGDRCFFVLSFDFVDEVFRVIDLPESVARASLKSAAVRVVGGGNGNYLYVHHSSFVGTFTYCIWVMKEYGVVESWNKIFHFEITEFGLEAPSLGITIPNVDLALALCVTDNGEKLLMRFDGLTGYELYLLDLEVKGLVLLESGEEQWELYPDYFAETLALLDKDSVGALMSY